MWLFDLYPDQVNPAANLAPITRASQAAVWGPRASAEASHLPVIAVAAVSDRTGSATTYKATERTAKHLGRPSKALHFAYIHQRLSGLTLSIAAITSGQERSRSTDGAHLRTSGDPGPTSGPGASQPIGQRLGAAQHVHGNADRRDGGWPE